MGTVLLYFVMVVTIATLNVNGLRDPTKRDIIFSYLTRRKIGITLMQETHSESKDEKAWRNQWGGDIMFSHGSTNSKGVAILVAPKTGLQLTNGESDTEGRWVKGDIIWEEKKLSLISIYAPNLLYPRVHLFEDIMGKLSITNNLIMAGDFNCLTQSNPQDKNFISQNDFPLIYISNSKRRKKRHPWITVY